MGGLFTVDGNGKEKLSARAIGVAAVLFLFAFLPLLNVGYTTNDETHVYYVLKYSLWTFPAEFLNAFKLAALSLSRSVRPSLPSELFLPIMGGLGGFYDYPLIMRVASIILHAVNVFLFYHLLRFTFRSVRVAYLGVIFFILFVQNSWDHNLLVSYFQHLVYFLSLQSSILLLFLYFKDRETKMLLLSLIFYFFALSYETILMYLPVCMFISWLETRTWRLRGAGQTVGSFWRPVAYFAGVSVVYLLVYFGVRAVNADVSVAKITPESFSGYSISGREGRGRRIAETVFCHGISSFPGFVGIAYHRAVSRYSVLKDFYGTSHLRWLLILAWVIKALLGGYIVRLAVRSIRPEDVHGLPAFYAIVLGFYLIFAPGLPVSIVQKYQDWVESGVLGFTNTYFSFYGMMFLIAGIVSYLWVETGKLSVVFRRGAAVIFLMAVVILSLFTDYSNSAFTNAQSISNIKWKSVDRFLGSELYRKLPSKSIIYSPSLYEYLGIMKIFPGYWTDYFAYRAGETYNILDESALIKRYCEDPRVIFTKPGGRGIMVAGTYEELSDLMKKHKRARLYRLNYVASPDVDNNISISTFSVSELQGKERTRRSL